jgi:hypothetical protein
MVSCLEGQLTDLMLFHVMFTAEANYVAIRWFEPRAAVSPCSNVCALDCDPSTPRDYAVMPSHPGTMARA